MQEDQQLADDFDVAVRGGTIVTPRGRARLDLYVRDGHIAALEPQGRAHLAREVVDASDLLVLPGMVDTHVHLMDPGDLSRETFPSGSAAAACSGVTTIIEHSHCWPVTSCDKLAEKRDYLTGRSYVDYGLAAHVWPDQLARLRLLWAEGVSFFKIFTCATHGVPGIGPDALFDVLGLIASFDGACLVHCEDDLMTRHNERALREAGRLDPGLLTEWRSREAELVAVGTVALAARMTGVRATIAHVSSPDVVSLLSREQRSGSPAVAETCPQYLFLREDELQAAGPLRKFTPPARIRSVADEDAMWAAFNSSAAVHHLSTDHAPSTMTHKRQGTIWDAPFGLPGLDTTFPLMLDAALSGRTSLERVVEAYSQAPARQYRLSGKGRIAVGADADLVMIDPGSHSVISNSGVVSKAGWTPYAGRPVQGRVVRTLLRGSVIAEEGRAVGELAGRFLPGPGSRGPAG